MFAGLHTFEQDKFKLWHHHNITGMNWRGVAMPSNHIWGFELLAAMLVLQMRLMYLSRVYRSILIQFWGKEVGGGYYYYFNLIEEHVYVGQFY